MGGWVGGWDERSGGMSGVGGVSGVGGGISGVGGGVRGASGVSVVNGVRASGCMSEHGWDQPVSAVHVGKPWTQQIWTHAETARGP